jgi:hypothetical protein
VPEQSAVVYDFEQDAARYLNARDSGETIEITEGTFNYFLEVLPPAYMGRTIRVAGKPQRVAFGFAEGYEPITAFWTEKRAGTEHYYCKRTEEINRS